MRVTSAGHRVVTGLGVVTFAGVGLFGSLVGGLGVRAQPAPEPAGAATAGKLHVPPTRCLRWRVAKAASWTGRGRAFSSAWPVTPPVHRTPSCGRSRW